MLDHWLILLLAGALDAVFGYPRLVYDRIRHPVVWMGQAIAFLEKNCNRPEWPQARRKALGIVFMAVLLALTLVPALLITRIFGGVVEAVCIVALLAGRSLYEHVHDVYEALLFPLPLRERVRVRGYFREFRSKSLRSTPPSPSRREGELEEAREKLGHIVGRDVAALDVGGICRAAIESLAESFSDGVVAPFFWAACFGLPGIAAYKAINTADSMIGHREERFRAFGWAAARLDDLANLIPARLSGLLLALLGGKEAWKIMWCDARNHASPNAGWPEAAMSGALGLRLGGPQIYDGITHDAAFIGDGTREATPLHLRRALRLYVKACVLLWLIPLLAWLATAAGR